MHVASTPHARRGPGRPRAFDVDAALDAALLVFRERGYHGASLAELGEAMKLTPGSIYKAFADKRAVFLAAFDRYKAVRDGQIRAAIAAEGSGFAKVRGLLRSYADLSHDEEGRRGCLVTGSAVEIAAFDPQMAEKVAAALARIETLLRELIREGVADGSIDPTVDVDAAAAHLLCVLQGFRVVGKVGRDRSYMMDAADQALKALPRP
ncbi:TetR/AcrR family transcriptional regulator [Amorphus sp. MBR-141]